MVAKEFPFDIEVITFVMICSIHNIFLGLDIPKICVPNILRVGEKLLKILIKYFTFFSHDLL